MQFMPPHHKFGHDFKVCIHDFIFARAGSVLYFMVVSEITAWLQ
jgi:hypothetical protein